MKRCATTGRAQILAAIAFAAAFAGHQSATAAELITNGWFETGSFAGWSTTDQAGGSGQWFISAPGAATPVSGFATSAAGGGAHGAFYPVTDQTGPGAHALAQSFAVAAGASAVILSFDLFVNDQAGLGGAINPAGLDFNAVPNQHARVDILSAGAGAFDTGATVLGNFYLGIDAGANPHPFTHYSFDITALVGAGGSFILRFAEVDNQFFFNAGVDNVSVFERNGNGRVPEPATLGLLGLGMAALGLARRRRMQN